MNISDMVASVPLLFESRETPSMCPFGGWVTTAMLALSRLLEASLRQVRLLLKRCGNSLFTFRPIPLKALPKWAWALWLTPWTVPLSALSVRARLLRRVLRQIPCLSRLVRLRTVVRPIGLSCWTPVLRLVSPRR